MNSNSIQISNDYEVMSSFRLGERSSLEFIVRRFQRELIFFANNIIHRDEVAEEIVDDIFIKVWQRRADFETLLSLKSFLYISVKNACLDYLKSPKNKPLEDISEISFELPSADNIEANIIYAELVSLIYREANKLPKKQQQVFLMFYIEGLTMDEIASRLNISSNAVYINKYEATKTMRKLLGVYSWALFLLLNHV